LHENIKFDQKILNLNQKLAKLCPKILVLDFVEKPFDGFLIACCEAWVNAVIENPFVDAPELPLDLLRGCGAFDPKQTR
jgi:hypothetical protein